MFLKEFFEKVNFEKKSAKDNKSMKNYPACRINDDVMYLYIFSYQLAPFFVLDEIDAALDNTNIGKVKLT